MWKAIEQVTADASAETRSKCDGLMAVAQAYARGARGDRAPVEVVMTVAQETLGAGGDDPASLDDGTRVSAESAESARFVHEHGYRVELDQHQRPAFFDPSGRRVEPVPPRSTRRPAWDPIDLAPPHLPCGWTGQPVDYSLAIDGLLSADVSSPA